jgi:hypothetical protein
MSNIEDGYCPVEEYTAFEEHRRLEAEFQVDELYMMMFSLKSRKEHQQAAKKPSRVTDIEQRESGLYLVKMTILNTDLRDDCETEAVFRDGYRLNKGSRRITVGGHKVRAAYMKTYYGEMDEGLHSLIEEGVPITSTEEVLEPITV